MLSAAVGSCLAFGVNFPFADEWADPQHPVRPAAGIGWLWERHNEHLLPLPRLVYWSAFRLTGDLRAGMLLSAVGWSVLAKLLIERPASRPRPAGLLATSSSRSLLLNWSQYENLLMSYQVGFMCSTVLAGLTLRELVLGGANTGRLFRVGLYTALLPMCGGHGLVLSAPGILWLAAAACEAMVRLSYSPSSRSRPHRNTGGRPRPPRRGAAAPDRKTVAVGLLGFGSVGYGLAGWHLWPWLAACRPRGDAAAWAAGRAWHAVGQVTGWACSG